MEKAKVKGLIFDLNGTMVNDMYYHNLAWFEIVNKHLGGKFSMEEVAKEMYGKNEEVLARFFGSNAFSDEKLAAISMQKEMIYQELYLPHLALIAGLDKFLLVAAAKELPIAIGSAAIPFNIDFVLNNLAIGNYFNAIVSADDVINGKPHPEVFIKCAHAIGIERENCLVFEDSPKGAEAALRAGMRCVAITTLHQATDFANNEAVVLVIDDYNDERLLKLINF
ncbi:MAG: HAD family hydrolase [Chitinophagaceae bacterium]